MAVPILAELSNLPALLARLRQQTFGNYKLYCCVNNEEGGPGIDDNQASLRLLSAEKEVPLEVIDRSSPGLGWRGKKKGVGWARKTLFDHIAAERGEDELIVSLDADTDFDTDYLQAVHDTFVGHPEAQAFAVPYYHPLSGDALTDRAMLRYECYMRHYLVQLQRINSPYAFTALGSAIGFPLWAYRRVGGITPLQGGEDFYLLQKFAKTGRVLTQFTEPYASCSMTVRPQGRPSSRVPFGTGPAIAGGITHIESRYPFYSPEGFDAVAETYRAFESLYEQDTETPMSPFLRQQIGADDLWGGLRRNFKSRSLFVHACAERVDGLRILQFLKSDPSYRLPDEKMAVSFVHDTIETLDDYRNALFRQEMSQRQ